MAAFEKIKSGIGMMDTALDSIRLGDNVVWQVDSVSQFRLFMVPFVRQAVLDGRDLIYVRFSEDPPLLEEMPGLKIWKIPLSHRFETFTSSIWNRITEEGKDAFYVFDCLSTLQTAWATDLMMGNFFKVTCPQLFLLDTVAYFPIIHGIHSDAVISKIRDTTQLFLDIYEDPEDPKSVFVHPLKVWRRSSDTMFLPHRYHEESADFHPLTNGIEIGRYYQMLSKRSPGEPDADDYWDRFFKVSRKKASEETLKDDALQTMCGIMMTRDERLRVLVRKYFRAEDYFHVRDRMIGTGMIGGKACGMLLARRIVSEALPEYQKYIEPEDSFFIGSDVFYTFLIENKCWNKRLAQRTEDGYFSEAPSLMEAIREGYFPEDIRARFRKMLDYFGASPIIVRSSSILEDGFGNAFAGKYDSVFCVNGGSAEDRLEEFESAVRRVYASTLNVSALEYRRQHHLEKRDEQMSLLVQRVSGSYFGRYFFPCAAGVGYSYSAWRFLPDMDPFAGMLRIVAGLGTKAVDRQEGDYPRMMSLDSPEAFVNGTVRDRHRYSQKYLDVLDIKENRFRGISLDEALSVMPLPVRRTVLSHDTEAEAVFRERGVSRDIWFVTCQGLARNVTFTTMMKDLMNRLQDAYGTSVDIEYAVNIDLNGEFAVNLLQCRPLKTSENVLGVTLPGESPKTIFHTVKSGMGESKKSGIQALVYIDPVLYYEYDYVRKPQVAQAVGMISQYCYEKGFPAVLIAPGRIGTSSPELGVPVNFAQIDHFLCICEVECSESGYRPELSFGSHMFQDLVEAEITYCAVFEAQTTSIWRPETIIEETDHFRTICPEMPIPDGMVHVSFYEKDELTLYYDSEKEELMLT